MSKKSLKYWKNNRTWTHPITGTKYAKGLMGLCRQICLERATNHREEVICEWCRAIIYDYANMHHIWGRHLSMNVTTDWNPDMCAIIHPRCHVRGSLSSMAVHDNDGAARQFFLENRGQAWYDRIMDLMNEHVTWAMCDPEAEEARLLKLLKVRDQCGTVA